MKVTLSLHHEEVVNALVGIRSYILVLSILIVDLFNPLVCLLIVEHLDGVRI